MENPSVHEYGKFLTEQEKLEEEIFLGFRKSSGVDIYKIYNKFNIDFESKYASVLQKYGDFIEKEANFYKLNLKGILLSNIILAEFLS